MIMCVFTFPQFSHTHSPTLSPPCSHSSSLSPAPHRLIDVTIGHISISRQWNRPDRVPLVCLRAWRCIHEVRDLIRATYLRGKHAGSCNGREARVFEWIGDWSIPSLFWASNLENKPSQVSSNRLCVVPYACVCALAECVLTTWSCFNKRCMNLNIPSHYLGTYHISSLFQFVACTPFKCNVAIIDMLFSCHALICESCSGSGETPEVYLFIFSPIDCPY